MNPGFLIPIVAMMIPIVAILTKHQQRMAEMYTQGNQGNNFANHNASDIASLREEVRQLRELSAQQTLAYDNLQRSIQTQSLGLQDRINNN